jgi:hypothetical protein
MNSQMNSQRPLALLGCILAAAVCLSPPLAAAAKPAPLSGACQLHSSRGAIQHVIHVQFDNTHLTRDNPCPRISSRCRIS